ncbi:TadE/TadG family type IV pilus assembly protein [Algicella marina]|uniref:TadE-like domain-containing protein n=1 Tax=Algicella marina TaxID=2683284 RepID=A0A6P1STK2_9RHOB|nr:TadE family protein [Algicella marina]QHQ33758.1 hypothetical protein GO499_00475 [Algicella marina]
MERNRGNLEVGGHRAGPGGVLRNEGGNASVEFVLWVPVFLLVLSVIVDASFIFLNHANMWSVTRDTARRVSMHQMTASEAQAHVESSLATMGDRVSASADDSGLDIWVEVSVPMEDVDLFGVLNPLTSNELVARVTLVSEPR